MRTDLVKITDELDRNALSSLGLHRQMIIADIAGTQQFTKGRLCFSDIFKRSKLKKGFSDEILACIPLLWKAPFLWKAPSHPFLKPLNLKDVTFANLAVVVAVDCKGHRQGQQSGPVQQGPYEQIPVLEALFAQNTQSQTGAQKRHESLPIHRNPRRRHFQLS